MEFKTLDELLSLDDVKRLGITIDIRLTFTQQPIESLFSKNYQQKQVFEDLREDLTKRLLSYSPFFSSMRSGLERYFIPIAASRKEDGSFYFHYSYHHVLPFFLSYFIQKYKMDVNEIMMGLTDLKLDEDQSCFKLQEFFLNAFKKINQSFNRVLPNKQEEAMKDRKFAKFLSKHVFDIIDVLKQPITLPILEDINKDRFLFVLSLQALDNIIQMGSGEIPYSDSVVELSIGYLDRYLTITNYLTEKSGEPYNFSFKASGEFHAYPEVVEGYQWCLENHPEMMEKYHQEMDMKQIFREYLKDARTKIKKDEFVRTVKLRFELFPKGEAKETHGTFIKKSTVSEDIKRLLEEKHETLLEEKINYFSSTDYLWTLEEAQTFNGYRGHIYPNGKVIFEKFYRTTRNGLSPAYDEAIIAMDLLDFIEVAPKTKTELIDLIRNQKEMIVKKPDNLKAKDLPEQAEVLGLSAQNPKYKNIRRIYHVPGWQSKVEAIINEDVPEYDFDLIETLLSSLSNTKPMDKTYTK